ncbi:hypothetical protein ASPZODRAFT_131430 [Penicilliopsis zonata CBS 506.65]|uniref:PH domain-containing protein n=1 Tax=Penicilliopsis zonata CBS 506.65 TaxID=1073090 RepID=A0A1L9SKY0_9EURO|nr:hypothetical protein ASPZODRAFT_131430 [Penicilliopsis zonata CBS 506.65]OJJ47838.1 hypothetical protein ASPZODRAFT_131430 [Penicilliopsis zonata CBS 506.65]
MVRSRVFSFISALGGSSRDSDTGQQHHNHHRRRRRPLSKSVSHIQNVEKTSSATLLSSSPSPALFVSETSGGIPSPASDRQSSRASVALTYSPPLVDVADDTLPELSPIFTFLNSHSNKRYQEGYFLKLNDLDIHGRPCPDRQWLECYAQLVGTVLSLWDSAALDAAENEGEVPSTFINLADASIKMIETLPTQSEKMQPLKNILSISSAGKNRYLLHFPSLHALTQWTAAIRLAMFEHVSLYEAYTGSIIAGKGKMLNNIRTIMERCKFKHEDWARVRFGAGTPWRRCWFVIHPPNEKEMQKLQKASKKKSAYTRAPHTLTGTIEFYESKKTKKAQPIATITHVYSAYAIYPQSKPLIDQSTLVKLEGHISVPSRPQSTEGFVFIMPEVHPAVSGLEMMLRFLFPTFDTFGLYGRPTRLVADTTHQKSIMFAFPKRRRYGYLDTLDVAGLIHTAGSENWSEAEWRRQLKEATARRMAAGGGGGLGGGGGGGGSSESSSVSGRRNRHRASLPPHSEIVRSRLLRHATSRDDQSDSNQSGSGSLLDGPRPAGPPPPSHNRGQSDTTGLKSSKKRSSQDFLIQENSPHSSVQELNRPGAALYVVNDTEEGSGSDSERDQAEATQADVLEGDMRLNSPLAPVALPPAFAHAPGAVPPSRPQPSPELQKAKNRMSNGTLSQLVAAAAAGNRHDDSEGDIGERGMGQMMSTTSTPPAVPEHRYENTVASSTERVAFIPPADHSRLRLDIPISVKRKPVPQPSAPPIQETPISAKEPSFEDLRHTMDEDALSRVGLRQLASISPDKDIHPDEDSTYDDASTASPDYASTHESVYSKRSATSVPKPRMGVMKTVGEQPKSDLVIGDGRYAVEQDKLESTFDLPAVDFGPTLALLPTTRRPSTSDTLKAFETHKRNPDLTAAEDSNEKRYSLGAGDHNHTRSGSRGEEFRRSMLWQPGMAVARPESPGSGLTPEQFVQQRARAMTPPLYVPHHNHNRSSSMSPPPPQQQPQLQLQQRPVTSHLGGVMGQGAASPPLSPPSRPQSRGASSLMNYNDISSHLSAREQEHVARVTGSSFFNLSADNSRPEAPVNPRGLVSVIDAREREKRSFKEGLAAPNPMVQQAIAQRQHMFHQQQQQQQQQQQHYALSSQPATPSMYGGAPPIPPQHGHQQSLYSIPTASHTWDALSQMPRADEPRRQSWYGPFVPTSQGTPSPPAYQGHPQQQQQQQQYNQHINYFSNYPNA